LPNSNQARELLLILGGNMAQELDHHVLMEIAAAVGMAPVDLQEWSADLPEHIARNFGDDPYLLAAVFSSLNQRNLGPFTESYCQSVRRWGERPGIMAAVLSLAATMENKQAVGAALKVLNRGMDGEHYAWQYAALADLLDTLERRHQRLEK